MCIQQGRSTRARSEKLAIDYRTAIADCLVRRKQVVMTNWETTFAKPIAMTQVDTAWVLGQTTPPTLTNAWNEDDLYKIVAKCY
jgi:hypothetical protein